MKGIFGLFTYFSQLDRDGSGYLEKDEIEYLAEMFFGQGDKAKVQKYVNEVFDKFDYDHSGELSYEEARDFIKDVYQFIDKCGGVSDEQRNKFLEVMACDDAPADIKDQEKQQLNEYKDEKIARRASIMPGDIGEEERAKAELEAAKAAKQKEAEEAAAKAAAEAAAAQEASSVTESSKPSEPEPSPVVEVPVEFDATKAKRGPNGEILGPDGKPLQRDADGYLIGPNGERLGPNGERLGLKGELLGPDGKPLVGPNGEMLLAPDGRPAVGPNGELLGPDGKPLLGPNGEMLGPDGKPLLGPNGELLGPDGKPVLGPDGKPMGPNGEAVAVLPEGVKLGPDGKPILGPNGCLMGADGKPLLGPNGELLGPDGKPLLGPNGEMLGPDGKPVLGPGGVALGPDGKPLLGPDGQPLVIGGEDEIVAGKAAEAGSAMADFNFEIDPDELARRQAEQEARRKALIAGMKDKKKRFEVRAYENDGWCKMLQIWRPKATVDAGFIKEKNVKSKWFRDPNTDQWISRDRVENPRPKEDAPAGAPAVNAAA